MGREGTKLFVSLRNFVFPQMNIDSSLPAAWVAEFETIMNNLGTEMLVAHTSP